MKRINLSAILIAAFVFYAWGLITASAQEYTDEFEPSFWDVSHDRNEFELTTESVFEPDFEFFKEEVAKKNGITMIKQSGILTCSHTFLFTCDGIISDCITEICPDYAPSDTIVTKVILGNPIKDQQDPFFQCLETYWWDERAKCQEIEPFVFNDVLNCEKKYNADLERCLNQASASYVSSDSSTQSNYDSEDRLENQSTQVDYSNVAGYSEDSYGRCSYNDSDCQALGNSEREKCIEQKTKTYTECLQSDFEDEGNSYIPLLLISLVIISIGGAVVFIIYHGEPPSENF